MNLNDIIEKDGLTKIKLHNKEYEIKTPQYESLMKIIKSVGTTYEELQKDVEVIKGYPKNLFIMALDNNIYVLGILGYGLKTVPKEIEELKELNSLYLKYNNLKKVPEVITQLPNLKVLSMLGNSLNYSDIPKNMFNYLNEHKIAFMVSKKNKI